MLGRLSISMYTQLVAFRIRIWLLRACTGRQVDSEHNGMRAMLRGEAAGLDWRETRSRV
jgi:hypothetical protein